MDVPGSRSLRPKRCSITQQRPQHRRHERRICQYCNIEPHPRSPAYSCSSTTNNTLPRPSAAAILRAAQANAGLVGLHASSNLSRLWYTLKTPESMDGHGLMGALAEYDPIDHLNQIFSHPATLASVSTTSEALRSYQDDLDEDIAAFVASQAASDQDSVARIQAAKAELADLFTKIESVRARAMETEHTITEMTADIKRLDSTKRNLTLSMTALKRLQMLTTAYEQLRSLSRSRQYRECAQLLQAVIQLVAHFKSYRSIDQIATLSRNVADLQGELLEQICEDFEVVFAKGEVAQRRATLAEACLVMDALGDHARTRLINWYCNTQLREYRQVFRGNDEVGTPHLVPIATSLTIYRPPRLTIFRGDIRGLTV